MPLATAVEVKESFDQAPQMLQNYFAQSARERGLVEMEYLQDDDFKDPWHLVIHYKGEVIYDKILWAIYQVHGITSDGTDVIVVTEYESPGSWSGVSVVFVNGEIIPLLQSLPVNFGQRGDSPAAVREIREYQDGWFIIYATLRARGDYDARRWAMYHPGSKEFVDCGELNSNRDPTSWGPSASPLCVLR